MSPFRKFFTPIFLVALAFPNTACKSRLPAEPPDRTGIDNDNGYHKAFSSFFENISNQSSQSQKELLAVYYYNDYMQRIDMPPKSIVVYSSIAPDNSRGTVQCWIIPQKISFEQVQDAISKGPNSLDNNFPHSSTLFSPTAESVGFPQISPQRADSLYRKTELACKKSKITKYVLNEMSNCEWYAFRANKEIGIISKHDLERYGESNTIFVMDKLLNFAFSQYTITAQAGLTKRSTPPASRARTQPPAAAGPVNLVR